MTTPITYDRLLLEDGTGYLLTESGDRFLLGRVISDTQFAQWLRDQSSRFVVLAEVTFAYQHAGAVEEGTVYLSDSPYVNEDLSPPQPFAAAITDGPIFERGIDLAQLGGRGNISIGNLSMNNADGALDYLLGYLVDGRDVSFYIGDATWPFTQFRVLGAAVISTVQAPSDTRIILVMRDPNLFLDATIVGDEMTVGPNAGKPKPILIGQVYNFDLTPYLYDASGPSYYFNSYAMDSSLALADVYVRDAGVSLIGSGLSGTNAVITANATTDRIYTSIGSPGSSGILENDVLRFSGTTPFAGLSEGVQYWAVNVDSNSFQVSLTRGGAAVDITGTTFSGTLAISQRRYYVDAAAATITLSSPPSGRVTADILARGTSGDSANQDKPHAGFRFILDTYTQLSASRRDDDAFAALIEEEEVDGIQWGIAILDRMNVMDVLDEIALLTNSWYGWTYDGLLTVGKLDLQNLSAQTPVASIGPDDMFGQLRYENADIKFGKLFVDANKNVVVQTDGLAGAVTAANRSLWAQSHQLRVSVTDPAGDDYENNWWVFHKSAIDSKPLATQFVGGSSAVQAFVDERAQLFRPFTVVASCTVGFDHYALNPGDVVELTYPRYSLDAGVNFRVLSVRPNAQRKEVELTLVARITPNWDALGIGVDVPTAPASVTAQAGYQYATVAFTAPASNGGAAILDYLVEIVGSPQLGSPSHAQTVSASPATFTGLTNFQTYQFSVRARNSAGYSSATLSAVVTPQTSVPSPPQSVVAIAGSLGSPSQPGGVATISWSAPASDGGLAITSYKIYASPVGSPATSPTKVVSGSPLDTTAEISGLSQDVDYTFTVTATNSLGEGSASSASNTIQLGTRDIVLNINANTSGYNIYAQAGYPTDRVSVTVNVAAGVTVSGSTSGAMYTGSGWAAGSTIRINNLGNIYGLVGSYPALVMNWPVTIDNGSGWIKGGGGAGGTGQYVYIDYYMWGFPPSHEYIGAWAWPSQRVSASDGAYIQGGDSGANGGPGQSGEGGGYCSSGSGSNNGTFTGAPLGSELTYYGPWGGSACGYAVQRNGYTLTWVAGSGNTVGGIA